MVGVALAIVVPTIGLALSSLGAAADAPSAEDLETKVRADAARANQFGKASAGTAPATPSGPGTPTGSVPTGVPGEICLLGVCTKGASKRADPVPGWAGMDQRSFALAMAYDFVNGMNCLHADRHRKQLAAMTPPRNDAERQRQQKERDDLTKQLAEEQKSLSGVDCSQYQ
jgi:hypothetical protein